MCSYNKSGIYHKHPTEGKKPGYNTTAAKTKFRNGLGLNLWMNVENRRDKYKEQEYLDGAEEAVKSQEKQNWISIGTPSEKRQS